MEELHAFATNWGEVFGGLGGSVSELVGSISGLGADAFGGLWDAIRDLPLNFKAAAVSSIAALDILWINTKQGAQNAFDTVRDIWAGLGLVWDSLILGLRAQWARFTDFMRVSMARALAAVGDGFAAIPLDKFQEAREAAAAARNTAYEDQKKQAREVIALVIEERDKKVKAVETIIDATETEAAAVEAVNEEVKKTAGILRNETVPAAQAVVPVFQQWVEKGKQGVQGWLAALGSIAETAQREWSQVLQGEPAGLHAGGGWFDNGLCKHSEQYRVTMGQWR